MGEDREAGGGGRPPGEAEGGAPPEGRAQAPERAYRGAFARAYRHLYGSYGRTLGARILACPGIPRGGRALDLCCGSGELAAFLGERGFRVTGVDRSLAMLDLAREAAPAAEFREGDVAELDMPGPFDLVTSISHSLNHLPTLDALRRCLAGAARAAAPGAVLVFDLLTRRGLERWNSVTVDEEEDYVLIRRGFYDDGERVGTTRLSGFLLEGGAWTRFAGVLRYRGFALVEVREALEEAGWEDPVFTSRTDLATALDDPESRRDVVVRARRGMAAPPGPGGAGGPAGLPKDAGPCDS